MGSWGEMWIDPETGMVVAAEMAGLGSEETEPGAGGILGTVDGMGWE